MIVAYNTTVSSLIFKITIQQSFKSMYYNLQTEGLSIISLQ
jgi:hypothetical protein